MNRYIRQTQFAPLGTAGQQRLGTAHVLVCGCGALGSVIANTLVRAGVGHVRIVDRDFLELNNLQRQLLYTEQDVHDGLPKAVAAARHLQQINGEVHIEPIVADVTHRNVGELLQTVDVIADGTDNFETRFLLNDAAFHYGIPWVYGGCIGAEGQTMTIVPGTTACLRCLLPDVPPPEATPTCDTAGILAPIVQVIASYQAMEVLKLAGGCSAAISPFLSVFDLWDNRIRQIGLAPLRSDNACPTCQQGNYEWLEGRRGSQAIVLCGRNSVQISPRQPLDVSLSTLAEKLQSAGHVTHNRYLLRCTMASHQLTIFTDGRAIVGGTGDPAEARSLLARYVGQ